MAKIYETHQDFERDKLKEQSNRLLKQAHNEAANSFAFWTVSMIAGLWDMSRAWAKEAQDLPIKRYSAMSLITDISFGIGAIEMVRSWVTRNKAHNLELQAERLGPEHVILPPEKSAPREECKPCKFKTQPRTLLEHALSGSDSTIGKN